MDEKFNAILSVVLVPQVIDLITVKENLEDSEALNAFYQSGTYELLSDEKTKLWHYSPLTLYSIWKHEIETNEVLLPEN